MGTPTTLCNNLWVVEGVLHLYTPYSAGAHLSPLGECVPTSGPVVTTYTLSAFPESRRRPTVQTGASAIPALDPSAWPPQQHVYLHNLGWRSTRGPSRATWTTWTWSSSHPTYGGSSTDANYMDYLLDLVMIVFVLFRNNWKYRSFEADFFVSCTLVESSVARSRAHRVRDTV